MLFGKRVTHDSWCILAYSNPPAFTASEKVQKKKLENMMNSEPQGSRLYKIKIQTLSFNKSTGPNNSMPTSILKKIKKKISNPFSRIINNSFENGIFPILWKSAKVILIFKIGSRLFCRNYISIFLLSNLGKGLKKLNHFLEKHTFSMLFNLVSLEHFYEPLLT